MSPQHKYPQDEEMNGQKKKDARKKNMYSMDY